jgi:hypothetical protein
MGRIGAEGETAGIEIRAGDTAQAFTVGIWNNSSDRLSVSVTSPTGDTVPQIPARSGTVVENRLVLERAAVTVRYYFPVEGSGSQYTAVSIADPTPGIWTVTLYGDIILDGGFHAWLPITPLSGGGTEFLSPSPECTITVPATALGVITCGAYDSRNNGLYSESSRGPTRASAMSPDLVAPGVEVGGIFPGGYGAMSGTSAAAAITAGACALMLGWGIVENNEPSLNTYLIRANLIKGCERDAGTEYPNIRWGYGRLNLINAFLLLRGT